MDIEVKKGEKKTVTVPYLDGDGDPLDVSGATMSFVSKWDKDIDTAYAIEKEHDDFDMANAASGIVTFELDGTDTATKGTQSGECTAVFSATDLDRTVDIGIWIQESVA